MKSFYLSKVEASGNGKVPSSVELKPGVNIITGPSNTGKSYIFKCIDYMFGAREFPLDMSLGFDTISVTVTCSEGSARITRNSKSIYVENSSIPSIHDGELKQDALGGIYLNLLGIEGQQKIYRSQERKTQSLTLRSFIHLSMLSEDNIHRAGTILENPNGGPARASSISALVFLLYGIGASDDDKEDLATRKTKREAVAKYIRAKMASLNEEHARLQASLGDFSNADLDEALSLIESLESEISAEATVLNEKIKDSFGIQCEIDDIVVSLDRFETLRKQYLSDIKRLEFIADGTKKWQQQNMTDVCPFCHSHVDGKTLPIPSDSIEAKRKTESLLSGLVKTIEDLEHHRDELASKKKEVDDEISQMNASIKSILHPQLSSLRQKIEQYQSREQIDAQIQAIKHLNAIFEYDIEEGKNEEENETPKFKAKDLLRDDFFSDVNAIIKEGFPDVYFDKDELDLCIDGKKKSTQGKGYRAYLNSVLALCLRKYMLKKAKYSPSVIVLDSPLLTLKEKDTVKKEELVEDSMKERLIKFICDSRSELGQVIIIENEMPKLDYGWANVITFTKDGTMGRYGFLDGIR